MDLCFVLTRAIRFLSAFGTAVVFALVPTTHVAGAQPLSSSGQTGGAVATFTSPCITIVCGGGTGGTFVPPPWNATGSMSTQRKEHTATLLNTGKVLVAGGMLDTSGAATASAELYDPATGTWSPTGSLSGARADHTATLLSNGKVLVVGGGNSKVPYLATAEIYDPQTGHWLNTGA